jgi:large repetitive protein
VDTYLSAGTKIMINVREETNQTTSAKRYVPYITYAHASFPGTKHSVRVAWLADGSTNYDHGTEDDNMFTGKWEVMTVPVNKIPNIDEFICNGVPSSSSSWSTAGTTLTAGSNLNKSILVGYMTDSVYEGAILKADISKLPDELKK